MSTINEDSPLVKQILHEATEQNPSSGYGQVELLRVAFKIICQNIEKLDLENKFDDPNMSNAAETTQDEIMEMLIKG